jgi:hypothetical protein
VPWPPAQKLTAEIRDEDRELVIERRDLILEVHGMALVGPEEHLEYVLVPQVHEVLVHGCCELPIRTFHEEVDARPRVKHLES